MPPMNGLAFLQRSRDERNVEMKTPKPPFTMTKIPKKDIAYFLNEFGRSAFLAISSMKVGPNQVNGARPKAKKRFPTEEMM